MKLIYSQDAIADFARLREFIAKHDPSAAQRIAQELLQRLESLRRFPKIGKAVELAPDPDSMRDVVFGKYVIRYSLHASTVIVLRVWHHNEDRDRMHDADGGQG